jgi:methyltransferase (TIGR00027 family)
MTVNKTDYDGSPAHRPRPSRTSQVVATVRSGLTRPTTPGGDGTAQEQLCAGMVRSELPGPLIVHLTARTRCVDAQVLDAIVGGVEQVVVLGAGYDDRALRFRSPGVRYFEVDHPDTQADKARRLGALGDAAAEIDLVPADFRTDDVAAVLEGSGHDAGRPTLFVAEGLLVYLDPTAIVALLSGLHRRASTGSTLVATLAVHAAGLDSAAVAAYANAGRANAATEPWRTILPLPLHVDLLARAGWSAAACLDDTAFDPAAVPDRSVTVVAVP